jgi:hypothetical protein
MFIIYKDGYLFYNQGTYLETVDRLEAVDGGNLRVLEAHQQVPVVFACVAQVLTHQEKIRFK